MMTASMSSFYPAKARSYVSHIPLCSKGILGAIGVFYVLSFSPSIIQSCQLAPDKTFPAGAHRLNTYPFLHLGLLHLLSTSIALVPLLEKFELENGTITTLLMFLGPFSTFPGILYCLIAYVFGMKTPVEGSSIWVFLLFSASIYQSSRTTPSISIPNTTAAVPTLAIPLVLILITYFLIPHTSLIGHLCGALIGYGWGSGLLKFLAPPVKITRWIEEKLKLKQRLPSSYVSVDSIAQGRYQMNVLPMDSIALESAPLNARGFGSTGPVAL